MLGYAFNIVSGRPLTSTDTHNNEESAGKVGRVIAAVASIVIPVAAPTIWGHIIGSTAIGAGISRALTGAFGAGLSRVIGSAAVSALANAGVAYASGARGANVWRAAGIGALGGGANAAFRAPSAVAGLKPASTAGSVSSLGKVATTPWGTTINAANQTVQTTTNVAGTVSPVMNSIRNMFRSVTNGIDLNRISAAIINAAVNGQSMGRLDGLVAQQRAELDALRRTDEAQYNQRIAAATQILADADKQDPSWMARVRMADVAGIEANQFRQAMRNIAVKQGGSLDAGQRKAYERNAALHTGRSKALAWGQGWGQGVQNQAALRAQGAGLLTSPNYAPWQYNTELLSAQQRARDEASRSTWGGIIGAFSEHDYKPSTSPDPSGAPNPQEEDAFHKGQKWGRY